MLVVDDNTTNRHILEHQVAAWGMDSGSADSGPAALEMLRGAHATEEGYDAALLDMHMPGMDGLELARDPRRARAGRDPARAVDLVRGPWVDGRGEAGGLLRLPDQAGAPVPALRRARDGARRRSGPSPLVTRHTISENRARSRRRLLVVEDTGMASRCLPGELRHGSSASTSASCGPIRTARTSPTGGVGVIDDHTRVAYCELHGGENAITVSATLGDHTQPPAADHPSAAFTNSAGRDT